MSITAYRSIVFAAFAFAAAFMPASSHGRDNAIVIGQAIDLSGPNGALGRDYVAGIKTCFDAINASGGIGGKRIEYIVRDDRGQPDGAAAAASDLIERDHAGILLGGVGDAVTQAVRETSAFRRSDVTLYAPLASGSGKDDNRIVYWRPSHRQEVQYLLSYFGKLGIKEVGILYQESFMPRSAYEGVLGEIASRGMTVTGTARIGTAGTDAETEAKRLAATKPGFVLTLADTITTGLFARQFRRYAAQTIIAGTSLVNLSTLRELAGADALEWTVFSQVVPNPASSGSALQMEHLRMMKTFRDEEVSSLTLEGYAVARTLVLAMRQAGSGNRSVMQSLIAERRTIDLGGFLVGATQASNRLSNYLDVALFRRGSVLVF